MTTPLTEERLAEIKARADAATPGPWRFTAWDDSSFMLVYGILAGEAPDSPIVAYAEHDRGPEVADADMEFIAHAHQDVPYLLEVVERLRKRVAQLEGVLRSVEWGCRLQFVNYPECPWCHSRHPDGHSPDCALAAALAEMVEEE
jgi:hypothetical protein